MTRRRYIHRIGVEVEGGWDHAPAMGRAALKGDGSVYFGADGPSPNFHVGEIASNPMTRPHLEAWLEGNYPHHVNATCGIHVHMSFRPSWGHARCVSILMDSPAYWRTVRDSLLAWANRASLHSSSQFWPRMRGENRFCEDAFVPSNGWRSGNRYLAVNFCALRRHGTIEVRCLPAFKRWRMAYRAIETLLSTTEAYIHGRYDSAVGPWDMDVDTPSDGACAEVSDLPVESFALAAASARYPDTPSRFWPRF